MGGWYSSKHVNADFGLLADFLMDRRGRPGAGASWCWEAKGGWGGPLQTSPIATAGFLNRAPLDLMLPKGANPHPSKGCGGGGQRLA